jgi:hypothetical protein
LIDGVDDVRSHEGEEIARENKKYINRVELYAKDYVQIWSLNSSLRLIFASQLQSWVKLVPPTIKIMQIAFWRKKHHEKNHLLDFTSGLSSKIEEK